MDHTGLDHESCRTTAFAVHWPQDRNTNRSRGTVTEEHVGKVVDGRYRLDRLLGEGTTGAVYAATQLSIDRTVAIKLLHQGDDANFRNRFANEARAIGQLNQTNIVTLHDFGYDDDLATPYMVMEYAEGTPLSERMEEPMSTDLILRVALEVASALHHAHAQGILHRDLKPENVILSRADGRVDVAKVLDFGLAHLFDPNAEESESTERAYEVGPTVVEDPANLEMAENAGDTPSLGELEGSSLSGESSTARADDDEPDDSQNVPMASASADDGLGEAYGADDEEPETAIIPSSELQSGDLTDDADRQE